MKSRRSKIFVLSLDKSFCLLSKPLFKSLFLADGLTFYAIAGPASVSLLSFSLFCLVACPWFDLIIFRELF